MAEKPVEFDTMPNYFGIEISELATMGDGDTNLVDALIITNSVFLGLVVLFVAAKIYSKLGLAGRFQIEDSLMVLAMLVSLACSGILLYSIRLGLGRHIWDQGDMMNDPWMFHANIGNLTKLLNNGAGILYSCALNLAKVSIVILYIRAFPLRWFRIIMWSVGSLLCISFLVTLFVVVFQCKPIDAAWDWTVEDAKCVNLLLFLEAMAGFNAATDIILVFAPLPLLIHLQLSKAEKLALSILIIPALGVCAASVFRVLKVNGLKCFDTPYDAVTPMICAVIEVNIAIICGCVLSMKPILSHHFPSLGIFSRSLITVNELDHSSSSPESNMKNTTFTAANRIFSNYSSESIPNGYAYNRPTTPESPRTVKRDWAFDSMNSSSTKDRLSADPVNWDEYWRQNPRDDIGAPIDKDIRRKVEDEALQKAATKKEASSSRHRLSFSSFIPMDTFRRPSATSSFRSRDEDKEKERELRRQQSNQSTLSQAHNA